MKIQLLLISLILFSCSSEEKEEVIPPGILTRQQYAKVLADLALAESAANLNIKNAAIEKMDSVYAFNPFKDNNTTQKQYDSSSAFYAAHPYLYKDAYEEALSILSQYQSKRKAIKDSTVK